MNRAEFIAYLKHYADVLGSQKRLAQHCGIGNAYLSEIMRGTREPGPKVLRALGFQKVVRYERLVEEEED